MMPITLLNHFLPPMTGKKHRSKKVQTIYHTFFQSVIAGSVSTKQSRHRLTNLKQPQKTMGFTLIEILIALFIFTIVSLLLSNGLKNLIDTYSQTEYKARRLRDLQFTLLLLSHDFKQAMARPIINENGEEEAALIGTARSIAFTRGGYANPSATLQESNLKRVNYEWRDDSFYRKLWPVLDRSPKTVGEERRLLSNITNLQFTFLDQNKQWQSAWPLSRAQSETLPYAVKIQLILQSGEEITQLYVIPTHTA